MGHLNGLYAHRRQDGRRSVIDPGAEVLLPSYVIGSSSGTVARIEGSAETGQDLLHEYELYCMSQLTRC
jgi:hypothetical protein